MATSYVCCLNCGHVVTADQPLDRCEACRAGTTALACFASLDDAEDCSERTILLREARGSR